MVGVRARFGVSVRVRVRVWAGGSRGSGSTPGCGTACAAVRELGAVPDAALQLLPPLQPLPTTARSPPKAVFMRRCCSMTALRSPARRAAKQR